MKRILIAEDELFVALDLEYVVERVGYQTSGPFTSVKEADGSISAELPACAILDVRLTDGEIFPVADRLREAGVPILFHSGHADEGELLHRYPAARVCPKPSTLAALQDALTALLPTCSNTTATATSG